MKNKFEHILLSILLGLTVLLGLSFWLNTVFNFNIFCGAHWKELSKLQAAHIPISIHFYISIIIAIFIFLFGVYFIYRQEIRNIYIRKSTTPVSEPIKPIETPQHFEINQSRPPRLNLPKNMVQIAAQNNAQTQPKETKSNKNPSTNPYNSIIADTFSNNGYLVKQNPSIIGFIPNLFAIGNNEILWIGGVDCDKQKMLSAIEKLKSVFTETLEDIPININAFILDTMNKYPNDNNQLLVFKNIDELKDFIASHPGDEIKEDERENFDSYSEYIDTIIKYIKNL